MGLFDRFFKKDDEDEKKKFRESVGRLFTGVKETVQKSGIRKALIPFSKQEALERREKFVSLIPEQTRKNIKVFTGRATREEGEQVKKAITGRLLLKPLGKTPTKEEKRKREEQLFDISAFAGVSGIARKAIKPVGASIGAKLLKIGKEAVEEAPKILKVGGGRYQLGVFGTTDDVVDGIRQVAKQNEELIRTQRRGRVTFEETKQAAANLGMDIEKLKATKIGKTMNDAEIVASGEIVKSVSENVNRLSKIYEATPEGLRTPAMKAELLEKMNEQGLLLSKMFGAEAEAGRALNATKAIKLAQKDMTVEGFKKIFKQFGGEENVDEIFKKYNQLLVEKGKESAYKYVRSMQKTNFGDFFRELWYNSILSAPTTHLINSISNTTMAVLSPAIRFGAAIAEVPSAKIGGRQRERLFGEALADPIGGIMGIKDGVKKSVHMILNGYNVDDISLLELNRPESFLRGRAGLIKPTRWLLAADQFYKSINYSADLYAQAYRQAIKKGAKGGDVLKVTAEFINNPTEEMMKAAGKMAKYRVFQEEPGKLTSRILSLREAAGPAGTFTLPFAQTPANLLKVGVEMSPAGFVANVPRLRGAEQSDSIAKAAIGTLIAGALAAYAAEGKITGAAPRDRNQRDAFYREGKQAYALKVGDKWIQYNRVEPFNVPLTMVASAWDEFVNNQEAPTEDRVMRIGAAIGKNLLSQRYLTGVSNIFNVLDEPDRYGGRFLETVAVGFIPGSSFLRNITSIIDPTLRDPQGIGEAIRATIPGMSFSVSPRRTVFGEEVKKESALGPTLGAIFPIKITKEKADFVDMELKKLSEVIGYPVTTKFVDIGGEKGREAAELFLTNSGGYMKQWLYNFMNSDDYKNLNDDEKVKAVDKIKDLSRDKYRNRIMASAYLFNENTKPTLEEKKKLYNKLRDENIINSEVDKWIYFLRQEESQKVPF